MMVVCDWIWRMCWLLLLIFLVLVRIFCLLCCSGCFFFLLGKVFGRCGLGFFFFEKGGVEIEYVEFVSSVLGVLF